MNARWSLIGEVNFCILDSMVKVHDKKLFGKLLIMLVACLNKRFIIDGWQLGVVIARNGSYRDQLFLEIRQ